MNEEKQKTPEQRLEEWKFERLIGSAPTSWNGRDPSNRPTSNKSSSVSQPAVVTIGFSVPTTSQPKKSVTFRNSTDN